MQHIAGMLDKFVTDNVAVSATEGLHVLRQKLPAGAPTLGWQWPT